MQTIKVELGKRSYPIYIDSNLINASLGQKLVQEQNLKPQNGLVITNTTVAPLYLKQILSIFKLDSHQVLILPDGEEYKDLKNLEIIFNKLLENNYARDAYLIALGGGVIGDITGFAAACYQRGINFIQFPTTLLAQVDSSVGGKTAVNHPLGKNMIGAFFQPMSVYIDPLCLKTLPNNEFAAGMAEVIKYGIIWDSDFFIWLENNINQIKALDMEKLQYLIAHCCSIKADIVNKDETEQGIRALLNLGHTFGHAIEAEMGYGNWLHGEAVAAGMVLAAKVSYEEGYIDATSFERIRSLIQKFDLPVVPPKNMTFDIFMMHMQHDKKVKNGKINFVLPTKIGAAVVTNTVKDLTLKCLFA